MKADRWQSLGNYSFFFLFFGAILCSLNNSLYGTIAGFGNKWLYLYTVLINGVAFLYLFRINFKKRHVLVFSMVLSFALLLLLSSINNYLGTQALISLYQIITVFNFAILIINTRFNFENLRYVTNTIFVIFLLLLGMFVQQHFIRPFAGFLSNSNGLGIYSFLLLYFIFISERSKAFKYLLTFMGLTIMVVSDTRSVLIALMVVFVTWKLWDYLKERTVRYYGYFTGILAFIGVFILFYVKLNTLPSFAAMNNYIYSLTGKNITSGRDRIWIKLFEAIQQKPFFGYGTGTTPADIYSTHYSSHNLYVQTILQNGFVGLGLFVVILYIIWKRYRFSSGKIGRLSAAFFVGILVHQSFEVMLTQNNFSYGLIQWLIILVGLNKYLIHDNVSEKEGEPYQQPILTRIPS